MKFKNFRHNNVPNTTDGLTEPGHLAKVFGPGVRQQMLDSTPSYYNELTIEKLEEILNTLYSEKSRKFIVRTGKKGALSYLKEWYTQAMIYSGLPKDNWEERVALLLERDEKELKEGMYLIDDFGVHYEGISK